MARLVLLLIAVLAPFSVFGQVTTELSEKDRVVLFWTISVGDDLDSITFSVYNWRNHTVCVWIEIDEKKSWGYQAGLTHAIVPMWERGSLGGVVLFEPQEGATHNQFEWDWKWIREGHIDCPE